MDRALVLFSGGQDSTTCLAWACERLGHVETLGLDHGQRHRVEMDQRPIFSTPSPRASRSGELEQDP